MDQTRSIELTLDDVTWLQIEEFCDAGQTPADVIRERLVCGCGHLRGTCHCDNDE